MAEEDEHEEDPPGVSESESALKLCRFTSWVFSSSDSWSFRRDCLGRESGVDLESFDGDDGFSGEAGLNRRTVRGFAVGGEGRWLGVVCRERRGFGTGQGSVGRGSSASVGAAASEWDGASVGVFDLWGCWGTTPRWSCSSGV